MKIRFNNRFKRQLRRLPRKIQLKFDQRLRLFVDQPDHPQLRVHRLRGDLSNYRSFSVTGDVRVIFEVLPDEVIKLAGHWLAFGTLQ